jgi:hypothetical protein
LTGATVSNVITFIGRDAKDLTSSDAERFSIRCCQRDSHEYENIRSLLGFSVMLTYEDKTLEELDCEDWGKPEYDSYLVTTCHRLRRVPLRELEIEDLRILVGQQISLKYLLPSALDRLECDPFAEGDFYPGDLLKSVLEVSVGFWEQHPDLRLRMDRIIETA